MNHHSETHQILLCGSLHFPLLDFNKYFVMCDGVDELIHFGYVASLSSCGFLPAACCKIVNENLFQISPISIMFLVFEHY